ncbi:MAG: flagellar hook-associated protein FlgL [Deltaproteobacteria bacterium]|nr:flagellar hook-associated protein FlgL [Deltaproteobacteria bacterium]
MRVTHRSLQDHWLRDVQSRLKSVDQLNRQISSGKRVEKPSDDPAAASRILRLDEVLARNDQYLKNIEETLSIQKTSESVLGQVSNDLVRAKSLALEASSDTETSVDSYAEEVAGIKSGLLTLFRTQYEGTFLFAGTDDGHAPFDEGGTYRGNSEFLRVNIGNGQSVSVNLPGDIAFRETSALGTKSILDDSGQVTLASDVNFTVSDGSVTVGIQLLAASSPYQPEDLVQAINDQLAPSGANLEARMDAEGRLEIAIAEPRRGGEITIAGDDGLEAALGLTSGTKNLFGLLTDLETALQSDDPSEEVGKLLGRLDRAMDDVLVQRGDLGARTRNLESAKDRLLTYNVTTETLREEIQGVDLTEAVTRLSAEQQAYETALAAGAEIFNVSLLDYLT